jgi:cytosine/adenosine deaminase-related metal-dependent hydrolase
MRLVSGSLIVTNGTIVTCEEHPRVLEGGALSIRDGVIDEVADARAANELLARRAGTPVLDARGGVVMPGLVNVHLHLYSAFARGIRVPGPAPRNFIDVLERLWWRLDRTLTADDVYFSALAGAIESAKAGTTTLIDHHASPNACDSSLSLVHDALDAVGLRGVLAYEVSDRDGRQREGIAENARFIARCREKGGDGRFAGLFGLHASFTLSDATLAEARAAADSLGAPFHVHVAEDRHDLEHARAASGGKSVVRRLADAGILRPGTIAAHCIHLEDGDERILAERGVVVAHCPQSNTNNAVGTADVRRLLDAGVEVGLGTDGFTMSLPHEAQVGVIVHRLARRDPAAAFGAIAPGCAGDLAIFRYEPPTPLTVDSFAGHLLFGIARAPVAATVVAGRVVQRDGRIEGLDEERVLAECRSRCADFWQRFERA